MSEENLNEVKETELVKNQENIPVPDIDEDSPSDTNESGDKAEVLSESSKMDSPLEESPALNVDYLDKKILKPNNLNYPNSRVNFLNCFK